MIRTGSILSVESNQNVESKTKNVGPRLKKCGVQNSIFTSRNQLFWALLISFNTTFTHRPSRSSCYYTVL